MVYRPSRTRWSLTLSWLWGRCSISSTIVFLMENTIKTKIECPISDISESEWLLPAKTILLERDFIFIEYFAHQSHSDHCNYPVDCQRPENFPQIDSRTFISGYMTAFCANPILKTSFKVLLCMSSYYNLKTLNSVTILNGHYFKFKCNHLDLRLFSTNAF